MNASRLYSAVSPLRPAELPKAETRRTLHVQGVGWNCTNSMLLISAPAATPSPHHRRSRHRVRGFLEDAAQSAGGEQHGARANVAQSPLFPSRSRRHGSVVRNQKS